MPDSARKTEPAAEQENAAASKTGKKSLATLGIFGGVMIVEGLAIFFAMKLLGSDPDPTVGMMETLQTTTAPFEESKELEVAHVRVQNANGARTILYSVTITARVRRENEAMLQEFLENRKATLNDAISRIIRSTDEKHLAEPGLKRQVRFELSNLIGDDTVIEQILIPEFTPLPTGF
jgi:flagellar basal body-associated protein FliL